MSLKKILIADDDPAIVDAIRFILEDEGYQVSATIDGTAITTLAQERPDVLLLDIWMSGQDGREICRYLKQQHMTNQIPIIMISANRDCEDIARQAGADDFLTKPFELEDLLGKISQFL